jgi:hypothetical protein
MQHAPDKQHSALAAHERIQKQLVCKPTHHLQPHIVIIVVSVIARLISLLRRLGLLRLGLGLVLSLLGILQEIRHHEEKTQCEQPEEKPQGEQPA